MSVNTVAWFEIGTGDTAGAKAFYGGMFGWSFEADTHSGLDYTEISTGGDRPTGGIWNTAGQAPTYAIFYVLVSDVDASCRQAEELGGKVVLPPTRTETGLRFAHLVDPEGSHFAVFTPPAS